jgi:enoyl-CoA hydratase
VQLSENGNPNCIAPFAQELPTGSLQKAQSEIDAVFGADDVFEALKTGSSDTIAAAAKKISRNAPLAMKIAVRMIRAVRVAPTIETALDHEFRYTFRSAKYGDFVEGIRAAIIDRDRTPVWQHKGVDAVTPDDIARMTAPLGDNALIWEN